MTRWPRAPALFLASYLAGANALDPAGICDLSFPRSRQCTTARVRRCNMREIPSALDGAAGVASARRGLDRVPGAGAARSRLTVRVELNTVRFRQGAGGGPGQA